MVCIGIETAQYLELYDSIFDPWDFVAYASLLIPFYLIDTSVHVRDESAKES